MTKLILIFWLLLMLILMVVVAIAAPIVKCVDASTGVFCNGYKQIFVLNDWTDVFGEVHKQEPWNDGHDAMHCWIHDHPGYKVTCLPNGCK
jgi:hypothetical protein